MKGAWHNYIFFVLVCFRRNFAADTETEFLTRALPAFTETEVVVFDGFLPPYDVDFVTFPTLVLIVVLVPFLVRRTVFDIVMRTPHRWVNFASNSESPQVKHGEYPERQADLSDHQNNKWINLYT